MAMEGAKPANALPDSVVRDGGVVWQRRVPMRLRRRVPTTVMLPLIMGLPTLAFPLAAILGIQRMSSTGVVLLACVVSAAIVAAGVPWLISEVRRYRDMLSSGHVGLVKGRLKCVGSPSHKKWLGDIGVMDAGEPQVFLMSFTVPTSRVNWRTTGTLILPVALGLGFLYQLAGFDVIHNLPGMGGQMPSFILFIHLLCIVGIAWAIAAVAAPQYARISAGRLELLDYGLFGTRVVRRRELDLRGIDVECDLINGLIIFNDAVEEAIVFRWVPRRRDFVRAVLEAARSREQGPRAAEEELVG